MQGAGRGPCLEPVSRKPLCFSLSVSAVMIQKGRRLCSPWRAWLQLQAQTSLPVGSAGSPSPCCPGEGTGDPGSKGRRRRRQPGGATAGICDIMGPWKESLRVGDKPPPRLPAASICVEGRVAPKGGLCSTCRKQCSEAGLGLTVEVHPFSKSLEACGLWS